jgi:hypothetical protein
MVSTAPTTGVYRGVVVSRSGLYALWAPQPARPWRDFAAWQQDPVANGELRWLVRGGAVVPIHAHVSGAFAFTVRVGTPAEPAQLSMREDECRALISEPYRVVTDGRLVLSGVEQVQTVSPKESLFLVVAPGTYAVTIHLIDVDLDPRSRTEDGRLSDDALPDFVLTVRKAIDADEFRYQLETFD